ncbi:MAG: hypothetical protein JO297_05675 [Nitrososphaeraceae archaeon]|nr:hypothetical protein [Nitrososphaeraceae archaeon]
MIKYISYIVHQEHRPFSYRDFLRFTVDEKEYEIAHGTFRNKISKLIREGKVEIVYYSGIAFYTLKGITITKPVTPDHTGGTTCHYTPIYLKTNSNIQMD